MALEIPTVVPTKIVAGNTVQWKTADNSDLAIADSWVLSYALVIAGKNVDIQCTDNGDGYHLATITAAVSKDLPSGQYSWQAYLTKGTDRHPAGSGILEVLKNFAALDGGHDARTYWRRVLDNVQAVIEERATKDQSSYTVNGRQLSRTPVADLLVLYNKAKFMVSNEEKEAGLSGSSTIKVRF